MPFWLSPIGSRPPSLAKRVAFVFAAIGYYLLTFLLLSIALGLLTSGVVTWIVEDMSLETEAGVLFLFVLGLALPFLLLVNSSRLPRLQWATWWVLLVDAALRLVSIPANRFVSPLWRYGSNSFFAFDFRANDARWQFASLVMAACAVIMLVVFSLRQRRNPSPLAEPLDPSATT